MGAREMGMVSDIVRVLYRTPEFPRGAIYTNDALSPNVGAIGLKPRKKTVRPIHRMRGSADSPWSESKSSQALEHQLDARRYEPNLETNFARVSHWSLRRSMRLNRGHLEIVHRKR